MNSRYCWLVCGCYAVGILGVSIIPSAALAETPELFPHQDKILHALLYGGWAVLLGWALQEKLRRRLLVWMLGIVALAAAYGFLMEILQAVLIWVQRACSWGDMLANLVGAALGVSCWILLRQCR